jgi:hypothetical protein
LGEGRHTTRPPGTDDLEASDPYVADVYRRDAARLRAEHFMGLLRDLEKEESNPS